MEWKMEILLMLLLLLVSPLAVVGAVAIHKSRIRRARIAEFYAEKYRRL